MNRLSVRDFYVFCVDSSQSVKRVAGLWLLASPPSAVLLRRRTGLSADRRVRLVMVTTLVCGVMAPWARAQQAAPSEGPDSLSPAEADSIAEKERLLAEIEQLRREAAALRQGSASAPDTQSAEAGTGGRDKSELRREFAAYRDTVVHLTREGVGAFLTSFSGRRRGARERGYGGGIGPTLSVHTVDMDPVRQLTAADRELRDLDFGFGGRYETFLMVGGLGYGGIGNGVRIGGGGRGGSRSFTARVNDDTSIVLDVDVGFGGVLIEKNYVRGKMNLFAGGMAGGGHIEIIRSLAGGVFNSYDYDPVQSGISARFGLFEVHGGFTYSMLSWLHMGGDITLPLFVSPSGFENSIGSSVTDGFVSMNPGVRVRIVFGNIG